MERIIEQAKTHTEEEEEEEAVIFSLCSAMNLLFEIFPLIYNVL